MATTLEKIRILMGSPTTSDYSDEALQIFLDCTPSGSAKLAAALGLDAWSARQAIIEQKDKSLNSETDDRGMSKRLSEQATKLRNEEMTTEATIAVAEQSRNVFGAHRLSDNSIMRLG